MIYILSVLVDVYVYEFIPELHDFDMNLIIQMKNNGIQEPKIPHYGGTL